MIFEFKGGDHVVFFKCDNGKLSISNEKTSFKYRPLERILRLGAALQLYHHIKHMSESDFKEYVIDEFKKMGYTLVKLVDGVDNAKAKELKST
jgi:hypothetical protein